MQLLVDPEYNIEGSTSVFVELGGAMIFGSINSVLDSTNFISKNEILWSMSLLMACGTLRTIC